MLQQQIATQQQQLNHVQGLGLRLMEVLGRGHATIADLEVQLHKMMPPGPLRPDLAHSLPQQQPWKRTPTARRAWPSSTTTSWWPTTSRSLRTSTYMWLGEFFEKDCFSALCTLPYNTLNSALTLLCACAVDGRDRRIMDELFLHMFEQFGDVTFLLLLCGYKGNGTRRCAPSALRRSSRSTG